MQPAGLRPRHSLSRFNVGRSLRTGLFHVARRDGANEQREINRVGLPLAARSGVRSMLRSARQRNGFAVLH